MESATRRCATGFQPTPSSRRVTAPRDFFVRPKRISTNTLLAEGDRPRGRPGWLDRISTNTLLAEGDGRSDRGRHRRRKFQPTPSSRRVTDLRAATSPGGGFQPTPSSRRVTRTMTFCTRLSMISTNTLLAEGDHGLYPAQQNQAEFQPTPSSRRVTKAQRSSED